MASNEINTVGAIQDKFGGYWVEWSRSQCLTKAEILGSNVFTVNGNYGDTECPRMDDIAKKVNNTVLLLPGDSLYDQSIYGSVVSAGGGFSMDSSITHYVSQSYYFPSNYTQYCYTSGINRFLTYLDDFTMEAWVYPTASGDYYTIFSCGKNSFQLRYDTNNQIQVLREWSAVEGIAGSIPLNQWSHIALVHYNRKLSVYLNGQRILADIGTANFSSAQIFYIGANRTAVEDKNSPRGERFIGRMEQIRVSNTARYTSNFTPPSGPFPSNG